MGSSGLVAIIESLNVAYGVEESRPWWKQRLVALGLTIGLVSFLAVVLVLLGFGDRLAPAVAAALGTRYGWIVTGWRVVEWLLAAAFLLMAFNLLYILAPNVKRRRWHWLMPGTVLGAGLWLLVSYGFKIYLSFFNQYNLTYGSITAVIILLLWLYLGGIAMLVGGELNSEIEKREGRYEKASG
jgi:membrane protein